jgi:hypothetical protein
MKILLALSLVFFMKAASAAKDSKPIEAISKPEDLLEKGVDKRKMANQKFTELVRSTLFLMGPEEKLKASENKAEISTP